MTEMRGHFISRGYKTKDINSSIHRVLEMDRDSLLQTKSKVQKDVIPFITVYNPSNPPYSRTIDQFWPTLTSSVRLRNALDNNTPTFGYRRCRNLKDILVHAQLPSVDTSSTNDKYTSFMKYVPGNFRCGSRRCKNCSDMIVTKSIKSTVTQQSFQIMNHISCASSNVIYVLTCQQCQLQYVGQTTQPLRSRMNGHRSDIVNFKDKPVAHHFNQHGHSTFSVIGLERVRASPPETFRRRIDTAENRWIDKLRTIKPLGINLIDILTTR